MIVKIALGVLYAVSIVTMPWYVFMLGAVLLIAYGRAYVTALVGVLVFDTLYGAGSTVWGIPYLYLLVTLAVALGAHVLRTRLLE